MAIQNKCSSFGDIMLIIANNLKEFSQVPGY